ncbi:unnamed protein product [Closterium sp. NIES-64]|nr:unnamed protein product [Closterium sp. NIES-64]
MQVAEIQRAEAAQGAEAQGEGDLESGKHKSSGDHGEMVLAEDRSDQRHNWWSSFKSLWTSNELTPSADDEGAPREARFAKDEAKGGSDEGGEAGEGEEAEDEGDGEEGEEGRIGEEEYAGEEEEGGTGEAGGDSEGEWDEGGESDDEGEWDEEEEGDEEGEWDTDALGGMSAEELDGLWRAGDDAAEGEGEGEWEREGEGEGGKDRDPEWGTRRGDEWDIGAQGWARPEEADDVAETAESEEAEAEGSARREGSGERRKDRSGSDVGSDEADVTTTSVAQAQWMSDIALSEPEIDEELSLKGKRRTPQRSLIAVASAVTGGRSVVTLSPSPPPPGNPSPTFSPSPAQPQPCNPRTPPSPGNLSPPPPHLPLPNSPY